MAQAARLTNARVIFAKHFKAEKNAQPDKKFK